MRWIIVILILKTCPALPQSFTSWFIGDTSNVSALTLPATVLMGGGTESDPAMIWFLERSGGGDVVVLRATGTDGYNDYLYSDLGVEVNSVETIVFHDADAAFDPYVLRRVEEAEAIWLAGGDQWDYISYWRDTPMEEALQYALAVKQVPFGGTSAGMAIQGQAYFSAQNGTVTSATAMSNPYSNLVTLGYNDFLQNEWLTNTITDTHFDNPDRKGRLFTFMARLMTDQGIQPYAIACEEYTAVCIDENGIARVYGEYPEYDDFAWFLQGNCVETTGPEICQAGEPLTWNADASAVKAIKMPATLYGDGWVDLNDFKTAGGTVYTWENWWAESGNFISLEDADSINCNLVALQEIPNKSQIFYPNPASKFLQHQPVDGHFVLRDVYGSEVTSYRAISGNSTWLIPELPAGIYFISTLDGSYSQKILIY